MKTRLSLKLLLAAFCFGHFASAAECSPIEIITKQVDGRTNEKYRSLIVGARVEGSALIPRKSLTWTYRGRSGEVLLADVRKQRSRSCVMYLLRDDNFVSVGGNKFCKWEGEPKLLWSEKKAWIEFPHIIEQPKGIPSASNELTVHFSKLTGDICVLGLPAVGYDGLRCPDDEAPDSE